ncbi:MAG TPA: hypothetical protein VIL40_00605 [Thermaerobacter sp.]
MERRHRGVVASLLAVALAVALVGCAALSTGDRGSGGTGGAAAGGGAGAPSARGPDADAAGAAEVEGVTLTADKERYRPGEPITLTVHNETADEIQLTGALGGLKGWRVTAAGRQPWDHGMAETTALVPVRSGQALRLGPVPAPEEPGRYVLEVHFFHRGGGPAAVAVTVEVE